MDNNFVIAFVYFVGVCFGVNCFNMKENQFERDGSWENLILTSGEQMITTAKSPIHCAYICAGVEGCKSFFYVESQHRCKLYASIISSTTGAVSSPGAQYYHNEDPVNVCITSCAGLSDGDYQSCNGCTVYASCSDESLIDNRPCPADLVWDDDNKYCDISSTTCTDEDPVKVCITSCAGLSDGDYQSCNGCTVYASCSDESLIDNRPCPADLVWDDDKKYCDISSTTCTEDDATR